MTKLNSSKLADFICSAGITYLPAEQMFYGNFPYKVEFSLKFKGLGGVSGKRACQIDISDTVKARAKLHEFVEKMNKIFANVECRNEIKEFIEGSPQVEYKSRMGGENNLFYFRDPDLVVQLVERYGELINSVTGPINSDHELAINENNVLVREQLYYGRFRYLLEIDYSWEFFDRTALQLKDYLAGLDRQTWRACRLDSGIKYYQHHHNVPTPPITNGTWPYTTRRLTGRRRLHPLIIPTNYQVSITTPHNKIQIYLTDGNDYIYIKLLAAEYVKTNHEIVLFSELK